MAFLYPESEELLGSAEQPRGIDFSDHPRIAALNRICGELIIPIGSMLWAALIVVLIWAECFAK